MKQAKETRETRRRRGSKTHSFSFLYFRFPFDTCDNHLSLTSHTTQYLQWLFFQSLPWCKRLLRREVSNVFHSSSLPNPSVSFLRDDACPSSLFRSIISFHSKTARNAVHEDITSKVRKRNSPSVLFLIIVWDTLLSQEDICVRRRSMNRWEEERCVPVLKECWFAIKIRTDFMQALQGWQLHSRASFSPFFSINLLVCRSYSERKVLTVDLHCDLRKRYFWFCSRSSIWKTSTCYVKCLEIFFTLSWFSHEWLTSSLLRHKRMSCHHFPDDVVGVFQAWLSKGKKHEEQEAGALIYLLRMPRVFPQKVMTGRCKMQCEANWWRRLSLVTRLQLICEDGVMIQMRKVVVCFKIVFAGHSTRIESKRSNSLSWKANYNWESKATKMEHEQLRKQLDDSWFRMSGESLLLDLASIHDPLFLRKTE